VNETGPVSTVGQGVSSPVFVSYATADRKRALDVCKAIEGRGTRCWISSRDVPPGENYQEAIVRSLRAAPAMVLVLTEAANHSDEIKKELSLASRYRVPVIALRIEDVEPSDAFAYELSTRQWIDAFEGLDMSIDALVRRIGDLGGSSLSDLPSAKAGPQQRTSPGASRRALVLAAAAVLLLVGGAGASWFFRSAPAAHSMMVRLAGFQPLSADLRETMRDAVNAEIIAAFNAEGIIGVSTAPAAAPGVAPAYALGGTVDRVGDSIRVISHLTNERSGTILWSDSVDYAADQIAKVPHRIAVHTGTVVRCGLFGASTYHKFLPDAVFKDYMQFCQEYWEFGATKTLIAAQRVAAAAPDFSWGWSAVADGYMQVERKEDDSRRAEEARAAGRQAADRALALDPKNSDALAHKALLIDRTDWIEQESLLKRAIAAQPLDCGCEHFVYGLMLQGAGRLSDAGEQFRHATDMLRFWGPSQLSSAEALLAVGKFEQARSYLDTTIELDPDSSFKEWVTMTASIETGDYAAGMAALRSPQLRMPEPTRTALLSGFQAIASGDTGAKARAVKTLLALADGHKSDVVVRTVAVLSAPSEALGLYVRGIGIGSHYRWSSVLWYPSMRGVLSEPDFPGVAQRLGLIDYWRTTHIKPDVCATKDPPPFCRTI
jgi:Tfp pilus assembly protein PilF